MEGGPGDLVQHTKWEKLDGNPQLATCTLETQVSPLNCHIHLMQRRMVTIVTLAEPRLNVRMDVEVFVLPKGTIKAAFAGSSGPRLHLSLTYPLDPVCPFSSPGGRAVAPSVRRRGFSC